MAHNGSSGGTPVTLVVPPTATSPIPTATQGTSAPAPRPHLPFTGFDLGTALLLTALLLAAGFLLLASGRRPALPSRRT